MGEIYTHELKENQELMSVVSGLVSFDRFPPLPEVKGSTNLKGFEDD